MQVDRAGWHRSKTLKIPPNIFFIQQPPYSPETNSVEHIWDDIREKDLHNKYFKDIKNAGGNKMNLKKTDYDIWDVIKNEKKRQQETLIPVSYTHLTLPKNYSV